MTTYHDDYQQRLLYRQECETQDPESSEKFTVSSSLYAVKWTYPGAISSTTARVRVVCMYRDYQRGNSFLPMSGTIERWSDKGWLIMDEFCDADTDIDSEVEFREKLMNMAHAFMMGVPIDTVDIGYVPPRSPIKPPPGRGKYKASFPKDLSKKSSDGKEKPEKLQNDDDNYKGQDKKNDDDPDFDWI